VIATPINIMDSSPVCDGAAALILAPTEMARNSSPATIPARCASWPAPAPTTRWPSTTARIRSSWRRRRSSSQKALKQAGVGLDELDFFELHDAFTIMSALSLEATGFARRGEGWRMAHDSEIGIHGRVPISTMGGLKSRGHPVGATGVYQIVESVLQLTGAQAPTRSPDARLGMAQNIGGSGATIVTHILGVEQPPGQGRKDHFWRCAAALATLYKYCQKLSR
jgi:acetyl-CoA C-acetyltransferase